MDTTKINRIQKYEEKFNRLEQVFNQMDEVLNLLENLQEDFKDLMSYYGSEAWFEDVSLSEKPDFVNIPCGVLSQDAVYNFYQKQKELHFKNVRLSLDYLEQ